MRRNYFFSAPSRCACPEGPPAASSAAQSKKYTGAGRVPARGEANSFSAGMAKLAVRVRNSRFFVLAARYFRLAERSTRWAEAGPCDICLFSVRAFASGRPTRASGAKSGEEKTQRSVLHVSPSIRPAAGVAEARAHPARSASARLPNALLWHQATRLPIRRLLVPQCSLNITAGYARAAARALLLTNKVG